MKKLASLVTILALLFVSIRPAVADKIATEKLRARSQRMIVAGAVLVTIGLVTTVTLGGIGAAGLTTHDEDQYSAGVMWGAIGFAVGGVPFNIGLPILLKGIEDRGFVREREKSGVALLNVSF